MLKINSCVNKSLLSLKPQKIHGVNPILTYPPSGKSFYLPRFSSVEMQMARVMNKIAIHNDYVTRSKKVFKSNTVLESDLKRLTSETIENSYKRAFWINPKDNKGYHLLDEGLTKDGKQKLRILNEQGEFVKNAEVVPKTIILSDIKEGQNIPIIKSADTVLNHTDVINIYARRFNPFARYKTVPVDLNGQGAKVFDEIINKVDNNTTCVALSYANIVQLETAKAPGKPLKEFIQDYLKNDAKEDYEAQKGLEKLAKKTRVLAGAGNRGENSINTFLSHQGVEGVGGLHDWGVVHPDSSSRNSIFTQHYEPFDYRVKTTNEGVNITELSGTDYPLKFPHEAGSFLGVISGTSFATPVRAAKLALNEMMEGIL